MLKLLTAPVTNDRGPRYMERALAAIHQASCEHEPVTLMYAAKEGRVGLFLRFAGHAEELVTGPIAANYPNCSMAAVEAFDDASPNWKMWYADLELSPELFLILRHAQFKDLPNGVFADPVSGILRAVKPDDEVRFRVEIHIAPAGERRRRKARHAIHLLDREFFASTGIRHACRGVLQVRRYATRINEASLFACVRRGRASPDESKEEGEGGPGWRRTQT